MPNRSSVFKKVVVCLHQLSNSYNNYCFEIVLFFVCDETNVLGNFNSVCCSSPGHLHTTDPFHLLPGHLHLEVGPLRLSMCPTQIINSFPNLILFWFFLPSFCEMKSIFLLYYWRTVVHGVMLASVCNVVIGQVCRLYSAHRKCGSICHHTALSQYHCLHSLCCALQSHDLFIL